MIAAYGHFGFTFIWLERLKLLFAFVVLSFMVMKHIFSYSCIEVVIKRTLFLPSSGVVESVSEEKCDAREDATWCRAALCEVLCSMGMREWPARTQPLPDVVWSVSGSRNERVVAWTPTTAICSFCIAPVKVPNILAASAGSLPSKLLF